jgi:5-methylthioadenosine/S-adenosylhomocysteine deaminase
MSTFWLKNAWVVTQDSKRRVLFGSVGVNQGTITHIKSGSPPSQARNVSDAKGQILTPGFVQCHVHLCQTLFKNMADDLELLDWLSKRIWVFEAAHTAETLRLSAELGIYELLASGSTTLLDMGTVHHTEEIYKAVTRTGIRANVGKCLMDHPETTPSNLRESTNDALDEAKKLFKRWHRTSNDRVRASFAPRFVISCTERLMREVVRISRETGALIHTHASENLKEIQMVKEMYGCENIEYLHQLGLTSEQLVLAHCIWLKPNEKDILRRTGTNVVHCPSSNLKLASGFAHIPELRKMGINVALGADGAPCGNNLDMFQEMRLAALMHKPSSGPKAIRAIEALDMATRDGARALSWEQSIGSIEIGKRADIVLTDPNRAHAMIELDKKTASIERIASMLVYSAHGSDVKSVWVDGKRVYHEGKAQALNEKTLVAKARLVRRTFERLAR